MSPRPGATATIPLELTAPEVVSMDQETAFAHLTVFCVLNGASQQIQDNVFGLLRRAAEQPNVEVHILTETSRAVTIAGHDLIEKIVADPTAASLAVIALDGVPGTTWQTRMSDNICMLFVTSTNAQSGADV